MISPKHIKGFSLLELSISIAIIAMLVAAVTAGQSMKHRLELNQVIEDISNITAAVTQFGTTYTGSLPGDMWDAEANFGAGNTDNGNGNTELTSGTPNEKLLFWQHLALAGLIEGTFDGTTNGAGGRKATPLKGGFYDAETYWDPDSSHGNLHISAETASGNGLFTTKEAFDYDAKYDNSDPLTGSIRATDGADIAGGVTTDDCVVGGEYNLSNTSNTPCVLHFF